MNKSQRKLVYTITGVSIAWAAAVLACMFKMGADKTTEYIVVDKNNQKISYTALKGKDTVHVMDLGAFDTDSLVYKNINVGDTISNKTLSQIKRTMSQKRR